MDVDRRERVLRTLVRNLFSFHQQEIYLTVLNEYTDWSASLPPHPLNILDGRFSSMRYMTCSHAFLTNEQ